MTDELMLPGHERGIHHVDAVTDLDLPGIEANPAGISTWPDVTGAYQTIARAVTDCAQAGNALATVLDARFQTHAESLRLGAEAGPPSAGASAWAPALERSAAVELARRRIGAALDAQFDDPGLNEDLIVALAEAVLDFLLCAQTVQRLAGEGQRDSGAHDLVEEVARRRLSGLLDELEACFGLMIGIDAESLTVTPRAPTEARIATGRGLNA